MSDTLAPAETEQICITCDLVVTPIRCGERNGTEICSDLLCPVCGDELAT